MSKFYYQGQIQQENFLTPHDVFLRSLYGKYQLMILEALSVLLFAIISLVIYFFKLEYLIPFTYPYARILGGFCIGLAVINLIVYYFVIKKQYGVLLKFKSYGLLVIGILLVIFPFTLYGFIYWILACSLIGYGFSILFNRQKKSVIKNIIAICLIIIGVFFLFANYNNYKDIVFFILAGIFGCFLLFKAIQFRKTLKSYEDEQKGFTDYQIE